jgi:hypothetical protein
MYRRVQALLSAAVFGVSLLCPYEMPAAAQTAPSEEQDVIPKQWLDKKISVEQAEAQNLVDGVPFGAQAEDWKRLKAAIKVGDELWTYCSSFESFKALAGRCGIAIVRDGKVVQQLVTIMN